MAFRRRRRFRGNWIPSVYDEYGVGLDLLQEFNVIRSVGVVALGDGSVNVQVGTVAIDNVVESTGVGTPLNDTLQGGWSLRRIVGKALISTQKQNFSDQDSTGLFGQSTGVAVTLGFFVARVDSQQDQFPIGTGDPVLLAQQYNPQNPLVSTEPWIWRRTWILGSAEVRGVALAAGAALGTNRPIDSSWTFPPNNALYGSIQDGPHIDAKSRRRIAYDERLFFATAARITPMGIDLSSGADDSRMIVDIRLDLRCFGAIRRRKNRSAF